MLVIIVAYNCFVTYILQLRNLRPISLEGESLARSHLSKVMPHHLGFCARWLSFANSEHIGGILLTGPLSLLCHYLIKSDIFAELIRIFSCNLDSQSRQDLMVKINMSIF